MKYGYREVKKIGADKIRGLCIKNNWFTHGTIEDYDRLLNYGFSGKEITTDELVEMAEMICEYSNYENIKENEYSAKGWNCFAENSIKNLEAVRYIIALIEYNKENDNA